LSDIKSDEFAAIWLLWPIRSNARLDAPKPARFPPFMCNLYSLTKGQAAIRAFFRVSRDLTGNLPPMPAIFPDGMAPIVRGAGERQMEMMRWGMPCPPQFGMVPVTNIRNSKSLHWRPWLGPESRCLVPVTSFCEWSDSKPKITHWFALSEERPLSAFAGLWCRWHGLRGTKANPIEGEHQLFGFLTTDSNDLMRPIHAKAMPVVLSTEEEFGLWLNAPIEEVLRLQRPAPNDLLRIVARGEKSDGDAAVIAP
jgi:putative SOS response-associated peptidase YedK